MLVKIVSFEWKKTEVNFTFDITWNYMKCMLNEYNRHCGEPTTLGILFIILF